MKEYGSESSSLCHIYDGNRGSSSWHRVGSISENTHNHGFGITYKVQSWTEYKDVMDPNQAFWTGFTFSLGGTFTRYSRTVKETDYYYNGNTYYDLNGALRAYISDAANAANTAKAQAINAANAANTAKTQAVNSANTANTAKAQAETAANAANTAKAQAGSMGGEVQAVTTAKAQAETAANTANIAKTQAVNSANTANTAKAQAETAANTANAIRTQTVNDYTAQAVTTAKVQAETAANAANIAKAQAEAAANAANIAKTQAETAANAANTAKVQAETAANTAITKQTESTTEKFNIVSKVNLNEQSLSKLKEVKNELKQLINVGKHEEPVVNRYATAELSVTRHELKAESKKLAEKKVTENQLNKAITQSIKQTIDDFDNIIKQKVTSEVQISLKEISIKLGELLDQNPQDSSVGDRFLIANLRMARYQLKMQLKLKESSKEDLIGQIENLLTDEIEFLDKLGIKNDSLKEKLTKLQEKLEKIAENSASTNIIDLNGIGQAAIELEEQTEQVAKEKLSHIIHEQKGYGAGVREHLIGDSFESYYVSGMDDLLSLRIAELGKEQEIKVIPSKVVSIESKSYDLMKAAELFAVSSQDYQVIMLPLLVPSMERSEVKHWVGIIGKKTANNIEISYLDSENSPVSNLLEATLVNSLKQTLPESQVSFRQRLVEEQRYNNCGPELIENIAFYLTNSRVAQEQAPYLHSYLWEQSLILENAKQANNELNFIPKGPQLQLDVRAAVHNTDVSLSKVDGTKPDLRERGAIVGSGFQNIPSTLFGRAAAWFSEKLDFGLYYKKLIYSNEVNKFTQIMQRNNIDCSVDILNNHREFKKSILSKLHPDKGGLEEEFKFVKNLEEEFNRDIDIKQLLDYKLADLQVGMHRTSIGFKVLDGAVDLSRLIYEPTLQNLKSTLLDGVYLHGMYYGSSSYSVMLAGSEVLYQAYNGAYDQAFKQGISTAVYLALPQAIGYLANPYFGLLYSGAVTTYTAYNALNNAYEFYLERSSSKESDLRAEASDNDLAGSLLSFLSGEVYDANILI